jgi:hypothetical protein
MHLVLERRIDSDTTPLTSVGHVLLSADHYLFVSQPDERVVRRYDANGLLVGTIGGSGRGPGEFGAIEAIALVGDTLYVAEPGRLNIFTKDGEYIRTIEWRQIPFTSKAGLAIAPHAPRDIAIADNAVVLRPGMIYQPSGSGTGQSDIIKSANAVPILHYDRYQRMDTVVLEETRADWVFLSYAGERYGVSVPYQQQQHVALIPDGSGVVVVSQTAAARNGATFDIAIVGKSGDTINKKRLNYTPIQVAKTAMEDINSEARVVPPSRDVLNSGAALAAWRRHRALPRVLPPVLELQVGMDGSVWLRRGYTNGERSVWEVFGRDLVYRWMVTMPRDVRWLAGTTERIALLELTEYDEPQIRIYRTVAP